jgi:hypothetical protein
MRRLTWDLLLVAFAVSWEYSLDFGWPLGNIARLAVIAVVLVAIGRGRHCRACVVAQPTAPDLHGTRRPQMGGPEIR